MEYRSWAYAALVRAVKTFAQALGGVLAASAAIQEVNWAVALGAAGIATVLSVCTSIAGLPEVE